MDLEQLKRAFIPNRQQLVVCSGITLALFLLVFRNIIAMKILRLVLKDQVVDVRSYLSQGFNAQLFKLSQLSVTDFLVKAVFFAGVGLIAYIVFLAVSNLLIEARNSVIISTSYTNKGFSSQWVGRLLLQVSAGIALLVFLLISSQTLVPLWLTLFQKFLLAAPALSSWLDLAAAFGGCTVNLFLAWSMLQIVFALE